LRILTP